MHARILQILLATVAAAPLAAATFRIAPAVVAENSDVTLTLMAPKGHTYFIHYGFNGWNLPLSGAGAGQSVNMDNTYFYRQEPMHETASGDFEVHLHIPAGARALHFVFCFDGCGNQQWDNNNGHDYAWPIAFPYIGPILTWNAATAAAHGVVISFEHPVADTAMLKLRKLGAKTWREMTQAAATFHRFELTSLDASTTYEYQIASGAGHVSAVYQFKTLAEAATHLSFVVFGDAQDNGETGQFSSVAEAIRNDQSDVDFLLSTGDLPWNDTPGDWWTFFDKGKALLATKVFMPAVGNHDTPTPDSNPDVTSFNQYFALPSFDAQQTAFAYRAGPASFLGMNSERPTEMLDAQGTQSRRLDQWKEDNERDQVPWRFAYWHICPINIGTRHYGQQFEFRPLLSRLEGEIDWLFTGHEHLYQRTEPLVFRQNVPQTVKSYGRHAGEGLGVTVVPSGGAFPGSEIIGNDGEKTRELLAFPRLQNNELQVTPWVGYIRIDITSPNELRSRAFAREYKNPNGPFSVIDAFTIAHHTAP